MTSLRERLIEMAETASLYTYNKGRIGTKEELVIAAARLALEDAARACRPGDGYVLASDIADRIRALAEGLD